MIEKENVQAKQTNSYFIDIDVGSTEIGWTISIIRARGGVGKISFVLIVVT